RGWRLAEQSGNLASGVTGAVRKRHRRASECRSIFCPLYRISKSIGQGAPAIAEAGYAAHRAAQRHAASGIGEKARCPFCDGFSSSKRSTGQGGQSLTSDCAAGMRRTEVCSRIPIGSRNIPIIPTPIGRLTFDRWNKVVIERSQSALHVGPIAKGWTLQHRGAGSADIPLAGIEYPGIPRPLRETNGELL